MTHLLTPAELNILYLRGMSAKHHNLEYSGVPPTDLLSLLAEVKAQRWRTIDSAPKNGKARIDLGAFGRGDKYWKRVPDCYWHKKMGRWITKHQDRDGYSALRLPFIPTHWMPRPAPPQED